MTRVPRTLITIDPGKHRCAAAEFRDGRLVDVSFTPHASAGSVIVCEVPRYRGADEKNPQTLLDLTFAAGRAVGRCEGSAGTLAIPVAPEDWKGAEKKPVQHARLWDILDVSERRLLGGAATLREILAAREKGALDRWKPGRNYYPTRFVEHNLLDAVAMGAWYVGRFETRGRKRPEEVK